MKLRAWTAKKILECHEPLISIPKSIFRLTPHPYQSLGAPYPNRADPWVLRKGVVVRLIEAQRYLSEKFPHFQLALFDAWRPISVQEFMFNYTIKETCRSRGGDFYDHMSKDLIAEVVDEVSRYWAEPSSNPLTPPPHSTGAAIDLTLADKNGEVLDLGGEIDFIGDVSLPDFYEKFSFSYSDSNYKIFHERRSILRSVMNKAGFIQHPNEWWHFSYGDQLWCWLSNQNNAVYGAAYEVSNDSTFSEPSLVT